MAAPCIAGQTLNNREGLALAAEFGLLWYAQ
jgi:hypothetical protein